VLSGAGASGAIAEPTGEYREERQGSRQSGGGGVVAGRWRGIGVLTHPVVEDQFEFGGSGQALEALFVGERERARRCGRRGGGFGEEVFVGFDQRERRGRFRAAAVMVEQRVQIHGLITSLSRWDADSCLIGLGMPVATTSLLCRVDS